MLGAANRALVVSEPMTNPDPFVPGRHFVESRVEDMADHIEHALRHPAEYQSIVNDAQRLVTEELTCGQMVRRVLDRAGTQHGEAG